MKRIETNERIISNLIYLLDDPIPSGLWFKTQDSIEFEVDNYSLWPNFESKGYLKNEKS